MISPKRRIWGWYFFDWASQPYNTLLLTFIFGPYFAEVATNYFTTQGMAPEQAGAAAQEYWAYGQTISGVLIALLAPILGAVADQSGKRMFWIWMFSILYVVGALGLWGLTPDAPNLLQAMLFFGIGLIGMEFATIFTNSLMPSLATHDEMGKVSGGGFAFGYLGGIVSLIVMLLFFAENGATGKTLIGIDPLFGLNAALREGTRAVGPFSALWFMLFMIPFFLWVHDVPRPASPARIGAALTDLWQLLKGLPSRPSLFSYLMSSMFYRDALNSLYGFGGVYAHGVLGWTVTQIGVFGIVGALSAALATWIGGHLDSARGPKPVIVASVWVLILVCIVIVGMSRNQIFGLPLDPNSATPDIILYICGALIGAAGGTVQSASRTMMVFHTTPDRATEAFGLYALSGKATSFIAPLAIGIASGLSGSQRIGISPLILLFLLGLVLLIWVKPHGEQKVAA